MERNRTLNYRGVIATPDMAKALRGLEAKAAEGGWRLELIKGVYRPLMAAAGREVQFRLRRSDMTPQQALNAAWGFAVPLGFTPWSRWPVLTGPEGEASNWTFHFLGDWQVVADNLLAEGRGHLAWPSVESAAQADVGLGTTEQFVQTQLHRVGRNPGPVDGVIGPRTTSQIQTLALGRSSLAQTALQLQGMHTSKAPGGVVGRGQVYIHGRQVVVQAAGSVQVKHQPHGALLTVTGPGRVVVDIGDPA